MRRTGGARSGCSGTAPTLVTQALQAFVGSLTCFRSVRRLEGREVGAAAPRELSDAAAAALQERLVERAVGAVAARERAAREESARVAQRAKEVGQLERLVYEAFMRP